MNSRIQAWLPVLALLLPFIVSGQHNAYLQDPDPNYFKSARASGWVTFVPGVFDSFPQVFSEYKHLFGLHEDHEMRPYRTSEDEKKNQHIRYHQYYRGYRVYGAEYILHGKNGIPVSGNGDIISISLERVPQPLTEEVILNHTLDAINATSYYWEDDERENKAKLAQHNIDATYFPKGELAWLATHPDPSPSLVYCFYIYTADEDKSGQYFTDALTGQILRFQPAHHACDPTSFNSNFNGNQSLRTNDVGVFESSYDLEDDCQASVYGVYDVLNDDEIFNTPDNIWDTDILRSAATSLWAIKQSYSAYSEYFLRLGHDHNDGELDIYHGFFFSNGGNNNASYSYDPIGDDEIKVGLGNTNNVTDDWNALDIMGHEFTHGVTQYEAALVYEYESGALNESFSDIFGEWVEYYQLLGNDWFIGGERLDTAGCQDAIRYMVDPAIGTISTGGGCQNTFTQPNTYEGTFWFSQTNCTASGNNDHCGVHTNSGVQNQMFYLLVEGGNGWNDGSTCHAPVGNGYAWDVDGIGMEDAIDIAYYALCFYLTPTSDYQDARNAWVHAAETLFGVCSDQAIQTGKAWYAVGLGPPAGNDYTVCDEIYGNNTFTLSTAGTLQTGTDCYVLINAGGGLVTFEGGENVLLRPGFNAVTGSRFRAIASECYFAAY